ncbi:MAG: glucose-1-phosphate cytidylyltransferase [Deltaproteobacteria bacterium]|jgi:glucose-1-phosphate cytidylyltransferase|nr:glucose-1-phosphate cytidylyltransferase [Deltaproteobacteria bacterium]
MKTVILCGGEGTRLREFTEVIPKPMVEIGNRPILWHIMSGYSSRGFDDFVLCLGYKGHEIKKYFLEYQSINRDFTVTFGASPETVFHGENVPLNWKVTLADTGRSSLTGTRLGKVLKYLNPGETFALTYGDGVSDVNLPEALAFHKKEGRLATVTGVNPPGRFGEIENEGSRVVSFWEKPAASGALINGGFFFFEPDFARYLPPEGEDEMLEHGPLRRCAADGELTVYRHRGFWQCMDTVRDWRYLEDLWNENKAPWKTWK